MQGANGWAWCRSAAAVTGLMLTAAACGDGAPTGPPAELTQLPRALTASEAAVVGGSNAFAFDILRAVNAKHGGENVFISPLSISMALGMTLNGAAGTTYDEMRSTLGFANLSNDQINQAYRGLIDLLLGLDGEVEMAIGNSIWYRQGFEVEADFLQRVEDSFDAVVEPADFTDDRTLDLINGWVSEATRGRIDSIIDAINGDDLMYLINAIYFKGQWRDQFDPARTQDDVFTGVGGAAYPVRMMNRNGGVLHSAGVDYAAIDLPYGNGAFTMTLVLPPEGVEIENFVDSLDAARWEEITSGMQKREMLVSVPRFRLEFQDSLIPALQSLGMEAPFVPHVADFSRINPAPSLYVSDVRHKSFVQVDEEGSEAAAVTSVTIGRTSLPPTFRADRPFVFAIREKFSGTILFSGKIVRPEPIEG